MVVGDSSSPAEMAARLAPQRPGLLFPLALLPRQAGFDLRRRAMQLVNLVLAGCGAFAFARWAPFGRAERALFVLGYLPFYEYAVTQPPLRGGAVFIMAGLRGRARPPGAEALPRRARAGARAAVPDHGLRLHPGAGGRRGVAGSKNANLGRFDRPEGLVRMWGGACPALLAGCSRRRQAPPLHQGKGSSRMAEDSPGSWPVSRFSPPARWPGFSS